MANDKQLKNKAVSIKGKAYVLVSDRVLYFNDEYKNGGIATSYELTGDTYHFRAEVTPDFTMPERKFTGHSQATIGDGMVNKTSALENAETSAVGRALAMMGIGVIESIASVDEMNKATGSTGERRRYISKDQAGLLVQKVKWGVKIYDPSEVIAWLDSVLGKSLSQLQASEMDDAISKVDAAIREDKMLNKVAGELPEKPAIIKDSNGNEHNLNDLPY